MKEISVGKITLNMGVGPEPEELKKAETIMNKITGVKPIQTKAKKKIPIWNLRPGLPIGIKVTLRKKNAEEFVKRALSAKENKLLSKNFDGLGNVGFGIPEYIDLPGTKYDPKLGIRGLEVMITLERKGFRIKHRKKTNKIGKNHLILKQEAMDFFKQKYGIEVE